MPLKNSIFGAFFKACAHLTQKNAITEAILRLLADDKTVATISI